MRRGETGTRETEEKRGEKDGKRWRKWEEVDEGSYKRYCKSAKEAIERGGTSIEELRDRGVQTDFVQRVGEILFYGTEAITRGGDWKREHEEWRERLKEAMRANGYEPEEETEKRTQKYYEYQALYQTATGLWVELKIFNDHLYVNSSVVVHVDYIEKAVETVAKMTGKVEQIRKEVDEIVMKAGRAAAKERMRRTTIKAIATEKVREVEELEIETEDKVTLVSLRLRWADRRGETKTFAVKLATTVEKWVETIEAAIEEMRRGRQSERG